MEISRQNSGNKPTAHNPPAVGESLQKPLPNIFNFKHIKGVSACRQVAARASPLDSHTPQKFRYYSVLSGVFEEIPPRLLSPFKGNPERASSNSGPSASFRHPSAEQAPFSATAPPTKHKQILFMASVGISRKRSASSCYAIAPTTRHRVPKTRTPAAPATSQRNHNHHVLKAVVRVKGLEPPRLAAPEPKSGASTNSATPARVSAS